MGLVSWYGAKPFAYQVTAPGDRSAQLQGELQQIGGERLSRTSDVDGGPTVPAERRVRATGNKSHRLARTRP